jgi:large conductance mechanosensitive channel
MKRYFKEFQEFAVKGNVIDLAVAVIIGGAFGKIVSSLVADIVMPLVGVIIGGVNFSNWHWTLKHAVLDGAGSVLKPAVVMNVGIFVQNIFDFLIIALAIFFMVKLIGRLKKRLIKEETEKKEEAPVPLSKDQELLVEIRDLLKNKE